MTKVLIIEDVLEIRENIAEILELHGYTALLAEDGVHGLSIAQKELPDLIICDVKMPRKDGFEVLNTLKKNLSTKDIPFIFLTASAQKEEIEKGISSNAQAYLIKPASSKEILEMVGKLLS